MNHEIFIKCGNSISFYEIFNEVYDFFYQFSGIFIDFCENISNGQKYCKNGQKVVKVLKISAKYMNKSMANEVVSKDHENRDFF